MIGRNDYCWCKSGKKWKKCHYPQLPEKKENLEDLKKTYLNKYDIIIKNAEQIAGIKAACKLSAEILEEVCLAAREGITTQALNDLAVSLHKKAGAIAAPLHYGEPPFPRSICTSLNEVICHGIPDKTPLKEGDILNIDVTCILDGYYGDCSKMVVVGKTTEERKKVVDVAYECLMRSVAILKPGTPISQIGEVIESYAVPKGCSVVNQFVGHGVGVEFHEGPQIAHCRNRLNVPLVPGMTFTIEPMINAGVREAVIDPVDKWTARTRDGKASAQFEHTLLITENGAEILTPWTW
ncbi:Methionine aminopeptidase [Chlamydiales bacterium STE3]|nr:Methionine aminopeptidase [Chlamydiales bacterium STE3]